MTGRIIGTGSKTRYVIDGKDVSKEEFDAAFPEKSFTEAVGDGSGLIAWHRPVVSDAAAVHVKQIPEAMARDKLHGLDIEYTPDDGEGGGGRPKFTSRGQRRAFLKSMGWHDNSGGYGDG